MLATYIFSTIFIGLAFSHTFNTTSSCSRIDTETTNVHINVNLAQDNSSNYTILDVLVMEEQPHHHISINTINRSQDEEDGPTAYNSYSACTTESNTITNFTLSNFLASLSSASRIGPQPTTIPGITPELSNHARPSRSTLRRKLQCFVFLVVPWL
jgi:hypothetical protein